jgi:hypothetical protein
MLHLLPTEYIAGLRREYRTRAVRLILLLAAFAVFAGAVALLPTYITLHVEQRLINKEVEALGSQVHSEEEQMLLDYQKETREKLGYLKEGRNNPLQKVEEILQLQNDGIRLNKLEVLNAPEGGKVVIAGVSQTRSDLLSFKEKLETAFLGAEIDIPLSVFAADKDLVFDISFIIPLSS